MGLFEILRTRHTIRRPCERVRSREIGERFQRSEVVEAFQSCPIGVNAMWEVGQESREEARRRLGVAASMDFDIDVAGGAVDRDEDITFAPLQGRQVLKIDVDETDSRLWKDADAGPIGFLALADGMAMEAAMNGTSGKLLVDATSHHLDEIV